MQYKYTRISLWRLWITPMFFLPYQNAALALRATPAPRPEMLFNKDSGKNRFAVLFTWGEHIPPDPPGGPFPLTGIRLVLKKKQ
jgi:hypothetical protein